MIRRLLALTTVGILAVGLTLTFDLHAQRAPSGTWITAWGTSQNGLATNPIANATVRMIGRVTIPGNAVRIRLDNTFGRDPVTIGKGSIGLRIQDAAVAAGSNHPLSFGGA